MAKKNVKKVKLADLFGEEGKPNAEFYRDDPDKRKNHLKYRTPRSTLVNVKGGEYKRSLSGNVASDIKYQELAREFISNGFKQTKAYAAVFGVSIKSARAKANRIFQSVWMRQLIHGMLVGTDGNIANVSKEYLLEKLMRQIESNVLDYIDNDGKFLNVEELKALPLFCQQLIKKLEVHTWHVPVMQVLEVGCDPVEVAQIRHQRVHLEIYDKQKAMELLAKAQQWINGDGGDTHNYFITAELMKAANTRVEKLRREDIEGEFKKVASD